MAFREWEGIAELHGADEQGLCQRKARKQESNALRVGRGVALPRDRNSFGILHCPLKYIAFISGVINLLYILASKNLPIRRGQPPTRSALY